MMGLAPRYLYIFFQAVILLLFAMPVPSSAGQGSVLHVAVASNFLFPLKQLAKDFQTETGIQLVISGGSTGMLYAQISHGAPYDIFLAADERRPRLLVEKGFAVKLSRTDYAYGHIILWGNDRQMTPEKESILCLNKMKQSGRLAIANPKTAPYGMAARESLRALDLWDRVKSRLVYGNNIAHTFQFVDTGNVDFGIVALSEYLRMGQNRPGCIWTIPSTFYTPIAQQAVILKRSKEKNNAKKFIAFLTSDKIQKSLESLGYGKPDA
ncbi:MAG: molybdate ABC transporter substrate-binding protein [Alphaproteobacteria bacterium]|nr:molybdate ABC transporter substrate-binding protein [Alphaproteobacteria bacterium]